MKLWALASVLFLLCTGVLVAADTEDRHTLQYVFASLVGDRVVDVG